MEYEDMLCWTATKDGNFSVKSYYGLLANEEWKVDSVWRLIWGSKLHERLKLFLWKFASNIIPVNMVVVNRVGRGDRACSRRGQQEEDVLHLFKECHISRALAFASKWSLRTSSLARDSPKEIVRNLLSMLGGKEKMITWEFWLKFTFCILSGFWGMRWSLEGVGILKQS